MTTLWQDERMFLIRDLLYVVDAYPLWEDLLLAQSQKCVVSGNDPAFNECVKLFSIGFSLHCSDDYFFHANPYTLHHWTQDLICLRHLDQQGSEVRSM